MHTVVPKLHAKVFQRIKEKWWDTLINLLGKWQYLTLAGQLDLISSQMQH